MNYIFTYPNQKTMKIIHWHSGNGRPISKLDEKKATELLYPTTYMLYVHLCLYVDGCKFPLSPKDIHSKIGLSHKQYYKAVSDLIESRYLVKSYDGENTYNFYTFPHS